MAFEIVDDKFRKHPDADIKLPERQTQGSAGYDFYSPRDVRIQPGEKFLLWSDVKFVMEDVRLNPEEWALTKMYKLLKLYPGFHLEIFPRSSWGTKLDLELANTVGLIDSDYANNESNGGNIGFCLRNASNQQLGGGESIDIKKGDRFAQGLIKQHFTFEQITTKRKGGIGSTGKGE
jgi:dUTP pyrophosphatase